MRLSDISPLLPDWSLGLVVILWIVLISLFLFVMYGYDKRRAERAERRIPEARLQGLALLGGWPGGLAGQQVFRHKTRKVGFQIVFWLIGLLQLLLLSVWLWPEPWRLLLKEFFPQWF